MTRGHLGPHHSCILAHAHAHMHTHTQTHTHAHTTHTHTTHTHTTHMHTTHTHTHHTYTHTHTHTQHTHANTDTLQPPTLHKGRQRIFCRNESNGIQWGEVSYYTLNVLTCNNASLHPSQATPFQGIGEGWLTR